MKLRTLRAKLRPSSAAKVRQPEKQASPFYLSPEWRALVIDEIERRFGGRGRARCQDPECRWPKRRGIRLFGDHVIEIKDGGAALDPRNILFRCGACHSRKTAASRASRLGLREG